MISFCLFGAGRIGAIHAENIARHRGAHLRAIVDVDAAAAERLASRHGAVVGTQASVLADRSIQAVVIASSTNTHADLVEAAARADKPLPFFLERYAEAYRLELDHFVDALAHGTPPLPGGSDGVKALALADAALRSLQTGAIAL